MTSELTQKLKNKNGKKAILIVKNLKKTYPSGESALKGVSLEVYEKEFVALIGLSGAGKSTLLRCINRLVEPDSGKVYLDGVELTSLDKKMLREARRNMGMIFQEFNLVERLTVLQNILTGRLGYIGFWRSLFRKFPKKDIERAVELADLVGMRPYIYKRADKLSGGQHQSFNNFCSGCLVCCQEFHTILSGYLSSWKVYYDNFSICT